LAAEHKLRGYDPRVGRIALIALAVFVFPAQALAGRTIGSPLTQPANFFTACTADPDPPPACTVTQTAEPSVALTAPISGVITRWRVRSISLGTVALRVLRPNPDGTFTALATSVAQPMTQRPAAGRDVTYAFNTRLTVLEGDRIAVDRDRRAGGIFRNRSNNPAFQTGVFVPPLPDNGTAPLQQGQSGIELMLNALIEIDADADGFGDESQDNCPKIPNDQTSNPCTASPAPGSQPTQPTDTGTFPGPDEGSQAEPAPTWRGHRPRRRRAGPGANRRVADEFRLHRGRGPYRTRVARRPIRR
jgi:hypothetical protein